jgi:hypothetical protein
MTLTGCDSICLTETDTSSVYLALVCGTFDRELRSEYRLHLRLADSATALSVDVPIQLTITDINDNPPMFNQSQFRISINASGQDGGRDGLGQVFRITATDADEGRNALVRYQIQVRRAIEMNTCFN